MSVQFIYIVWILALVLSQPDEEEKLTEDYELQAWGLELVADGNPGCGIKGVPGEGRFATTEQLSQAITSIIFASTVGHAAVNVSQYDEYAFLPNYPAILKGTPPRDKKWREEKEIVACLPAKNTCLDIIVISKLLSERHTNGLADFHAMYQHDPVAKKAISRFLDDLKCVALTILDRNKKRQVVYEYLNPSRSSK